MGENYYYYLFFFFCTTRVGRLGEILVQGKFSAVHFTVAIVTSFSVFWTVIDKSTVKVDTSINWAYDTNATTRKTSYEGPLYDCIVQPQTVPMKAQEASTMATGSMTHSRPDPLGSSDHCHIFPETGNPDTLTQDCRVSNSYQSTVPTSLGPTSLSPHTDVALNVSHSPQGSSIQLATVTTLKSCGDKNFLTQAITEKDLFLNQAGGHQGEDGDEYIAMKPIGTVSDSLDI